MCLFNGNLLMALIKMYKVGLQDPALTGALGRERGGGYCNYIPGEWELYILENDGFLTVYLGLAFSNIIIGDITLTPVR